MIVFENIDAPENAKNFMLTFEDDVTKERTTHFGTLKDFDVTQNFKEKDRETQRLKEDLKRLSKREHNLFIERETLKKDNKELQEKYEALKEEFKALEKANEHLEGKLELLKDLIRDTILNGI